MNRTYVHNNKLYIKSFNPLEEGYVIKGTKFMFENNLYSFDEMEGYFTREPFDTHYQACEFFLSKGVKFYVPVKLEIGGCYE